MNEQLVKRVQSLLWRGGMMGLAVFLGFLGQNLESLAPYLNATTITIGGLVLGEISKFLNTKTA